MSMSMSVFNNNDVRQGIKNKRDHSNVVKLLKNIITFFSAGLLVSAKDKYTIHVFEWVSGLPYRTPL